MAVRTRLLNGNNIARDTDFSKYIETVSEPGVIEGLTVTATKVAVGKCWVPCERANGETIYALVYNSSEASISGNGDVYIEVSQTYIDNGELANEDGTGIATIQVGTMPSSNALLLATITNGVVTDQRNMIRKVGELNTLIQSLNTRMNTVEAEIDQIKEDKAVDHLEETGLVGELYTLSNTLFKQHTPTLANSTLDANVGDTDANKQIHIQRLASGTASNQLKLKVKKVGAPTTGLVVEVRRGIQVDVSTTEAYWYGDEVVATGSIPYSGITTDYQEFTVNLNGQFGGTKGEKLDIVVYQTGNIVNSTNYYSVACDSTQYSEGFSFVAVNGTTRTRSKLMPYCIADGFAQSLLCKYRKESLAMGSAEGITIGSGGGGRANGDVASYRYDSSVYSGSLTLTANFHSSYSNQSWYLKKNGTTVYTGGGRDTWDGSYSFTFSQGDVITIGFNIDTGTFSYSITVTSGSVGIPGSRGGAVLKVNELKEIGQQVTTTSFGEFDDISGRIFYLGDDTITSVDTGNIALGNAIGFVQIGKYKIPYYL